MKEKKRGASREVLAARETRAAWLSVRDAQSQLRVARSRLNRALMAQAEASGRATGGGRS